MMNRAKLSHVLRAMASVTNETRFVVVGSAAVLLTARNIPAQMLNTNEVDAFAPDAADQELFADLVDGSLGVGSVFFNTFGYAGDGVSPTTAVMPSDWRSRATSIQDAGAPGVEIIAPDIDDIALAKMMAWREKDRDWLFAGARARILDIRAMRGRLRTLPQRETPADEIERRMKAVEAALST